MSPATENFGPSIPPEWQQGIDALRALPDGARAFLVGATDRGKTTFTALAARTLAADGLRTAVVDADIGQSEIGPPGTVGVAWADPELARLHELKPAARFFVGAVAPPGVALELAAATGQAVEWARAAGARRILIDTTGFVSGAGARRLKVAKATLSAPSLVIALQRGGEIAGLLSALVSATGAQAIDLPVPETVGRKSTSLRTMRRVTRLSQALQGAREIALPLSETATVGATLGTGEPLAPHLLRWIASTLRRPVVYGELVDGVLSLYVSGPAPRAGWEEQAAPVAEHFHARTVRALSLEAHHGVYIGLHDGAGRLLSVGRFLRLDVEHGEMIVSAPPPAAADRVRMVAFGRLRLDEDGSATDVRPGEI